MNQPELIVFDLDLTLWECGNAVWCDCLSPPFHRDQNRVLDRAGNQIRLYDDVHEILDEIDQLSIPIAIASRTHQPGWARELLGLLDIEHRFAFAEIYPEAKFSHFSSLQDDSGVELSRMMFFDDEMRNIDDISKLDVACHHVTDGMTKSLLHDAMREFSN